MPTTEQSREALALGTQRRVDAIRQRTELTGKPIGEVVPALIHPTAELGCLRLGKVFSPRGRRAGPIPGVGINALNRAFVQLVEDHPMGRQWWHTELRLDELTETERRRLVRVLVRQARKDWRAGE